MSRVVRFRVAALVLLLTTACDDEPVVVDADAEATKGPDAALGDAAIATSDASEAGPRSCTLIGCGAGFSYKTPLALSFAQLQKASVKVCRNDQCLSGAFNLSAPPALGTGEGIRLPDFGDHPEQLDIQMSPHVDVWLWGPEGSFALEVGWWAWTSSDLKDGDTYKIELADASGLLLSTQQKVEHYTISFPNGEECGPRCVSFHSDLTR